MTMDELLQHFQDDEPTLPDIDRGTLLWGMALGILVGGLVTLLKSSKGSRENRDQIGAVTTNMRKRVKTAMPADPIQESMAAGKAAAARRREDIGEG